MPIRMIDINEGKRDKNGEGTNDSPQCGIRILSDGS
jgi:hypothetical protein